MKYGPGEIRDDMSISMDRNAAVRRRGRNGIGNDGNAQAHKHKGEPSLNDYFTPEDALSFAFDRVPMTLITDPFQRSEKPNSKGRENRP